MISIVFIIVALSASFLAGFILGLSIKVAAARKKAVVLNRKEGVIHC